jgi:hypothetical protein
MGTIVISIIFYILLPTILSFLTQASINMMGVLMNQDLLNFTSDGNIMSVLNSMFGNDKLGVINQTKGLQTIPIASTIMILAFLLIALLTAAAVVNSFIANIRGEKSEDPTKALFRGLMTVALEMIIFGLPFTVSFNGTTADFQTVAGLNWFNSSQASGGLLAWLGWAGSNILSVFNGTFEIPNVVGMPFSLDPASTLVMVVLSIALFKGTIEAGIVFVERWLSFAMTILFGPIAVALNASAKTSQSCQEWFKVLFSQFMTIFISMFVLSAFLGSMSGLVPQGVSWTALDPNLIFRFAVALALLSLFKNSEKILNSWGLRTIANKDSVSDFGKGIASVSNAMRIMGSPLLRHGADSLGNAVAHQNSAVASAIAPNTKFAKFFSDRDPNPKAGIVPDGFGASLDKNGKSFSTAGISGKTLDSTLAVNNALSKEQLGTTVSGSSFASATGLAGSDKLAIKDTAMTAQTKNGSNAFLFSASEMNEDGTRSGTGTYAMVMNGQQLDPSVDGNRIMTKDANGNDVAFRIDPKQDAISMGDGKGMIYKVTPDDVGRYSTDQTADNALTWERYSKDTGLMLQNEPAVMAGYQSEVAETRANNMIALENSGVAPEIDRGQFMKEYFSNEDGQNNLSSAYDNYLHSFNEAHADDDPLHTYAPLSKDNFETAAMNECYGNGAGVTGADETVAKSAIESFASEVNEKFTSVENEEIDRKTAEWLAYGESNPVDGLEAIPDFEAYKSELAESNSIGDRSPNDISASASGYDSAIKALEEQEKARDSVLSTLQGSHDNEQTSNALTDMMFKGEEQRHSHVSSKKTAKNDHTEDYRTDDESDGD